MPQGSLLLRPRGGELTFDRELNGEHFAGDPASRFDGARVNYCDRTALGVALVRPGDVLAVHFPADLHRRPVGRDAGPTQLIVLLGEGAILLAFVPAGAALNLPFPA